MGFLIINEQKYRYPLVLALAPSTPDRPPNSYGNSLSGQLDPLPARSPIPSTPVHRSGALQLRSRRNDHPKAP